MHNTDQPAVACPACNGPLTPEDEHGGRNWVCEVGHLFEHAELTVAQGGAVVRSIWYALRALQDRAIASNLMAVDYERDGRTTQATRLRSQALEDLGMVERLHEIVQKLEGLQAPVDVVGGSGSHN